MPFGYNYLDLIKAREKGEFLGRNLNNLENRIYISMFLSFRICMLFVIIIFLIFLLFYNPLISNLFIYSYLLFALSAIILQGFRKVMLLKYNYYKNQKWYKTAFFIIVSFLWMPLAIIGFEKLIIFMQQFQTNQA